MTRLQAVLGAAGTGKSWYINNLIQNDLSFGIRTASTGIAALNMGSIAGAAEPTTINSALRYFSVESLLRNYHEKKFIFPLSIIAKRYKNIIIDEISLINAGTLDLIVLCIKEFNKLKNKDLGLLLAGDAGQLKPVQGYPFFMAKCWPEFKVDILTEVKRQDNIEFINALNLIRKGEPQEAIQYFRDNIKFVDQVNPSFRGTTLFPTNDEVDVFNRRYLNNLYGDSKFYYPELTGVKHPTWNEFPARLELKQGCIIQLLYNNLEHGFANGDVAIVNELWDKSIYISLLRKQKELFLRPRTLYHFNINSKGYQETKPAGSFKFLHTRLGMSQTIHKAQGLTLDNLQISLKGNGKIFLSKQSGMLYTALSRVKTPEGLTIVGTPEDLISCCYLDPSYKKYIL